MYTCTLNNGDRNILYSAYCTVLETGLLWVFEQTLIFKKNLKSLTTRPLCGAREGGPGAVVKAACLESSRVRALL